MVEGTYSCKQLFSQMNVVKNKLRIDLLKTTWCVSYEQVSTATLRVSKTFNTLPIESELLRVTTHSAPVYW